MRLLRIKHNYLIQVYTQQNNLSKKFRHFLYKFDKLCYDKNTYEKE